MKKLVSALIAVAAFSGSALAADLPAIAPYTKAPVMPASTSGWTGFYVFGGAGGGIWNADSVTTTNVVGFAPFVGTEVRTGGNGAFGTVGAGYDWQFNRSWVTGIFADGQFGSLRGSISNTDFGFAGLETLRDTWAVGARVGYLVAPNVYSYVNAGYTGSNWSGSALSSQFAPPNTILAGTLTTPSFTSNGWFVGGGVENSLNIFGISTPGLFMKTEYRAAYFGSKTVPETPSANLITSLANNAGVTLASNPSGTFKPLAQTISTSLVYRFNSTGSAFAADLPARGYTKAPGMPAANWTGFYAFGGGGGGLWNAGSVTTTNEVGGAPPTIATEARTGGHGAFGTLGAGYDWQFNRAWVAGIFADGQFGSLRGSISNTTFSF